MQTNGVPLPFLILCVIITFFDRFFKHKTQRLPMKDAACPAAALRGRVNFIWILTYAGKVLYCSKWHMPKIKEEPGMNIAVTYENGMVFQHFGHTEQFKLYNVADGQIKDSRILDTNGSGHGALAGLLGQQGVDVLICGGIGGGAQMALEAAGIRLCAGVQGDADEAVRQFLAGELAYVSQAQCDHHGHEGHNCGQHESHGCGAGGCRH